MLSVTSIALQVIRYQTEVPDKVLNALKHALPAELHDKITVSDLEGLYAEEMAMYRAVVTRKRDVKTALRHLISGFGTRIAQLENHFASNFESPNFVIKLKKFDLLEGKFILGGGSDVVKIIVKISMYKKMDLPDVWNALMQIAGE